MDVFVFRFKFLWSTSQLSSRQSVSIASLETGRWQAITLANNEHIIIVFQIMFCRKFCTKPYYQKTVRNQIKPQDQNSRKYQNTVFFILNFALECLQNVDHFIHVAAFTNMDLL